MYRSVYIVYTNVQYIIHVIYYISYTIGTWSLRVHYLHYRWYDTGERVNIQVTVKGSNFEKTPSKAP